jgi:DNA-directed RNA polymerase specialized sigma24 family protein
MSRLKGTKNKNTYIREGTDMNILDIAKELNLSQTEVETALKGAMRKFKRHFAKQNIQKEHYL